jgi:hypothetical protein
MSSVHAIDVFVIVVIVIVVVVTIKLFCQLLNRARMLYMYKIQRVHSFLCLYEGKSENKVPYFIATK